MSATTVSAECLKMKYQKRAREMAYAFVLAKPNLDAMSVGDLRELSNFIEDALHFARGEGHREAMANAMLETREEAP